MREFGVVREFFAGAFYPSLLGPLGGSSGRGRDGSGGRSSGNSEKTIPLAISSCGCSNSRRRTPPSLILPITQLNTINYTLVLAFLAFFPSLSP